MPLPRFTGVLNNLPPVSAILAALVTAPYLTTDFTPFMSTPGLPLALTNISAPRNHWPVNNDRAWAINYSLLCGRRQWSQTHEAEQRY